MKSATIIIGKNQSGKTLTARLLAKNYKEEEVTWIDGKMPKFYKQNFLFQNCSTNTKCIIIDEVCELLSVDFISSLTTGVQVNKRYKRPFGINPKIIITYSEGITKTQIDELNPSTRRRLEVIECKKEDLGKLIESI
jgi:hypothetical protein